MIPISLLIFVLIIFALWISFKSVSAIDKFLVTVGIITTLAAAWLIWSISLAADDAGTRAEISLGHIVLGAGGLLLIITATVRSLLPANK